MVGHAFMRVRVIPFLPKHRGSFLSHSLTLFLSPLSHSRSLSLCLTLYLSLSLALSLFRLLYVCVRAQQIRFIPFLPFLNTQSAGRVFGLGFKGWVVPLSKNTDSKRARSARVNPLSTYPTIHTPSPHARLSRPPRPFLPAPPKTPERDRAPKQSWVLLSTHPATSTFRKLLRTI